MKDLINYIICKFKGHKFDQQVGLVEGIFLVCSRCKILGYKIRDWDEE